LDILFSVSEGIKDKCYAQNERTLITSDDERRSSEEKPNRKKARQKEGCSKPTTDFSGANAASRIG
jgi:hypothetical protein